MSSRRGPIKLYTALAILAAIMVAAAVALESLLMLIPAALLGVCAAIVAISARQRT